MRIESPRGRRTLKSRKMAVRQAGRLPEKRKLVNPMMTEHFYCLLMIANKKARDQARKAEDTERLNTLKKQMRDLRQGWHDIFSRYRWRQENIQPIKIKAEQGDFVSSGKW